MYYVIKCYLFQSIMKLSSPVSCVICVCCILQMVVAGNRPMHRYSLGIRDRPAPGLTRPDGGVLSLKKAPQGHGWPRALKRSSLVRKTEVTKHPVGLLKQQILSSLSKSEQISGVKVSD